MLVLIAFVIIQYRIPPVIQLIGSSTAPVALGSTVYSDPGAVARDNLDGDLTYKIVTTGKVLTNKVGTYILKYSVSDVSGNKSSITRTVNVVPRLVATSIPQFVTQLLIPWAMPKSVDPNPTPNTDYYEIAMRQFNQQILPTTFGKTTVWGYGSTIPDSVFNAPSLTIEATANKPVRVKWINDLRDANGNYLPHLLPVDQTLDWANPAMAPMTSMTSMAPMEAVKSPLSYTGPVPMVTHVHGAHVVQESDGNPEAWFLPDAKNIPVSYMKTGMNYDTFKLTAKSGTSWTPGNAVFDYTNDQRDATIWYHDHAMGMTRNNVYAGPAGFFLIRGNPLDKLTTTTSVPAVLPGKALLTQPTAQEVSSGSVYEIPIALQDRSFNSDGSLYYPDSRANFDDYRGSYSPQSDIAPIWNPETFGDTIIANGNTWPTQNVQPKRYRLRFLNGAQARTFILKFSNNLSFTQIGAEQGFLKAPTVLPQLLIAPAERADVIVDFTGIAPGTNIILNNIGPDMPYNGEDQEPSNPLTTGKVMQFKVIASDGKLDTSTPPAQLLLPTIQEAAPVNVTRKVSLNEMTSMNPNSMGIGPQSAMLGTVVTSDEGVPSGVPQTFMAPITENIKLNNTEVWEIYNFTVDAHPIHLHLIGFEVINRQVFNPITGVLGAISPPNSWENGPKDTVLALPGQITRIKAKFDIAGLYMWHCHILEHEDNEMMRPYLVK